MQARHRFVSILLWINGLSAIYGGGYLLGGATGMDTALLEGSPFRHFLIPGLILLFVVGGSSTAAAAMRLGNHPWWSKATVVAGVILLIWIAVEFVMVPEYWPAQLAYGLVAVAILAGSIHERRSRASS